MASTTNGVGLRAGVEAIDDGADDEAVAGRQHAVLEDDEQRDVERRERAEDVLGLGVLPPCGGHGRAHLRVDHGHAGVEDAGEPAGHESAEHTALGHGEVPAHELPDEHDAHAKGPYVHRPEHAQQAEALGRRGRSGGDRR